MPMYWEFPEHLHNTDKCNPGIAEALSLMLMNNAGDSYADRGLPKGYELTEKVIEDGGTTLAIWFHLVQEDWKKYEKALEAAEEANKNRKKGEPKHYPMWASMVQHFGEGIMKRINAIVDEHNALEDEAKQKKSYETIMQWQEELRGYVGFFCSPSR